MQIGWQDSAFYEVRPEVGAASAMRTRLTRFGTMAVVGAVVLALSGVVTLEPLQGLVVLVGVLGFATAVAGLVLSVRSPVQGGDPLVVGSPVSGRWQAKNSPASKVPSHGTHAYGQTYAIDLVHRPVTALYPEFGMAGQSFLRPERFPAFGRHVHAVAPGVVVAASDGQRDHLSRSDWLAYAYLLCVEGVVRELGGPRWIVGNHVIVRLSDGSHFVYAHLRRGSVRVKRGDTLTAGEVIGEVGNSGSSTEPHLHLHRQDVAELAAASGLPWAIRGAAPGHANGFPPNDGYLGG